MKITNLKKLKPKKLIVFDLDGTLADSKSVMGDEMAELITRLLQTKKVAVIGGGKYDLFKWQFIGALKKVPKNLLQNLFLFPTSGNAFYRYKSGWENVYSHDLSKEEKTQIRSAFERVFKKIGYKHPKKVYGVLLEDRKSQMSFSPLGQEIVTVLGKRGLQMKEQWRSKYDHIRHKMAQLLAKELPNLEVRTGGVTTIDITMKGIDKAYGVRQMEKYLKVKVKDMLFLGDAIYPRGNDYSVLKTKIDYIKVSDPKHTAKVIKAILEK
ncbi:MAG: HAD-IIB family hydrolase [Candidatus Doudnabacteria bacterium]|nr:HAD-IIB family hydrolase [Candidatus Doudnabacteria bacterium]